MAAAATVAKQSKTAAVSSVRAYSHFHSVSTAVLLMAAAAAAVEWDRMGAPLKNSCTTDLLDLLWAACAAAVVIVVDDYYCADADDDFARLNTIAESLIADTFRCRLRWAAVLGPSGTFSSDCLYRLDRLHLHRSRCPRRSLSFSSLGYC